MNNVGQTIDKYPPISICLVQIIVMLKEKENSFFLFLFPKLHIGWITLPQLQGCILPFINAGELPLKWQNFKCILVTLGAP